MTLKEVVLGWLNDDETTLLVTETKDSITIRSKAKPDLILADTFLDVIGITAINRITGKTIKYIPRLNK